MFFDDVEVPADNLVGELNQGWRVATGALGEERAMLWLDHYERLEDTVRNFGRAADGTGALDDHVTQNWFGNVVIDATALWVLGYRAIVASSQGRQVAQQSILKLLGSEAGQAAAMHAFESLGPDLVLDPRRLERPVCALLPRRVRPELVQPLPAVLFRHHRRRHLRDPAKHRRRARARPPAVTAALSADRGMRRLRFS